MSKFIQIVIAFAIIYIFRKEITNFLMWFYGVALNKIVSEFDLKDYKSHKIMTYVGGGLHKQISFKLKFLGDGPMKIAYELGNGKQTKEFLIFSELLPDEKNEIAFSLYFGEDPCRIVFFTTHGQIGDIEEFDGEIPEKNFFRPNFLQTFGFKKRFLNHLLVKGNIIPHND